MNIVFFDNLEDEHRQYAQQELGEHDLVFVETTTQEYLSESREEVEVAVIFVTSKFSKSEFENTPNLKYIATRSTGFDHVDLDVAREKGVVVSNVPFYGSNTVAEHTMALLLSMTRKITQSVDRVKRGKFDYHGLRGVDLMGKKIGIIGGGHIGVHVAKMANGFGMDVFVYDVNQDPNLASEFNFTYMDDLTELLSQSDVVSLHLPLNEHTIHILNNETIPQIKDGAFLINTARGGLIETDALVKAINAGKFSGVALDVLESEEFLHDELSFLAEERTEKEMRAILEDHVLIEMEDVIVTPHNAFNTKEAHFRNLETTIDNVKQFIAGNPTNTVT